ncbi:SUN domain-containing protein 1-like protein [Lates japonicus]|uniref:SUN domain-containing protein 1-like protein n=1 Tax=Lates japonicus TaxID=270547 RepID=A0AAD3R6M7_LATJO|nr:SUN domain-containing protein 1-like protein [Lates japonicus]GLD70227.1 SUN domain-containing protein 1-like protein [Lates japonicus]
MRDEDEDLQSWGWTDLCVYSPQTAASSSVVLVLCVYVGHVGCVCLISSSYSSSASDSEKEQQVVSFLQTRIMSRRSLRLDDGLLDRSLPRSSASFSVGGGSWRSTRSLKSRRSQQHSASCSESLLVQTPRKPAGPSLLNSSLHSVASDASLLSSLLDESSIQESTLVDTFWGLDHDIDPKESTIIAEQSTVLEDNTLIGSDSRCDKHPVQTLSRVYCKDCELHSDRKESATMYCSSSKYTTSSSSPLTVPGPSDHREQETSTIYCRDRSRKSRTASCLFQLSQAAASALWPLTKKAYFASRSAGRSADKTAGEALRQLSRRWHHMTTSFPLTRFSLQLLVVLLPLLLLLFSLCWFGPAGLQSVFPAINITEWTRTAVSDVHDSSSSHSYVSFPSESAEGTVEESSEVQPYVEPLYSQPPPAQAPTAEEEEESAGKESSRLVGLEQSLTALWERVEARGQQAEQRHREALKLYTDLRRQQQEASAQSREEGVEPWLSGLLDQQLTQLRRRLDEERQQREQIRQQDLLLQQSQTSRLDQLELQLQALAAKTEEVQWRQEAATTSSPSPATLPAAVSVGVDRQSHNALLAEVTRLEAALEDVRRDVKGLSGFQDGCRRLEGIQQTISVQVSTQVREEVWALIYGNQLMVGGGGDSDTLSESLLQWLSQRYVSGSDLQAALASLELSILQNISLQLEQRHSEEVVREAVLQTAKAAGATVTEEDVHVIVKNALQLFSQDRTGLADYALESGGGSILSTRCSQTYETKAALLSLFGVPLWYFSQSPRAVIQPDIHPGNCWAFRGSTGFLVIRLSMRILPTAFSLEHIPKALAPSGTLLSAPRDFSVYGLDDESQERGKLLGTYTYDEDGESLQTYPVTEENDQAFQIIEVQVLSNWGHQEYTCMYRFRVHGTPSDD